MSFTVRVPFLLIQHCNAGARPGAHQNRFSLIGIADGGCGGALIRSSAELAWLDGYLLLLDSLRTRSV